MQLPKELQRAAVDTTKAWLTGLNEVQLPKELQRAAVDTTMAWLTGLNEVQLPKELQPVEYWLGQMTKPEASMKCSSRRNCNPALAGHS